MTHIEVLLTFYNQTVCDILWAIVVLVTGYIAHVCEFQTNGTLGVTSFQLVSLLRI